MGEPPAPPGGKPLYRLPEVLRGDPSRPVYVVEGEKAADALHRLGLLVTTSGGAGSAAAADWSPLRERKLRIWPDFDPPGARYGADVAALATIHAASVELLDVAALKLPEKGDAWDWRAANPGATAQDVEALPWRRWQPQGASPQAGPAANAPSPVPARSRRLHTVCAVDVEPEAVRWLWPGHIAIGKLTLIAGDPGLGKSMLTADLAARVTRGRPWPVYNEPCPQGGVLLISGEDDPGDTIRPRLDAAEADPSRVHILKCVKETGEPDSMLCLQRDLEALDAFLEEHPDVRLVSIDPLTAYLGETDSHKNSDVRALLQPLSELAARHRVALVAVSHLNKGAGGGASALYRVSGSLAFVAAARASFIVTKDQNDPARRLVLPSKNNLSQDTSGLAYRIGLGLNGAPRVEWEPEAVTMSADQALGPGQEEGAAEDVGTWLRELLSGGAMTFKQVEAEASSVGIPLRKLQRAAKRAGVESVREGFGRDSRFYWRIKGAGPAA